MIGALCLLALAGIAIAGPVGSASVVDTCGLSPQQGALHPDSPALESQDGIPISISIRNDGDQDERLLGAALWSHKAWEFAAPSSPMADVKPRPLRTELSYQLERRSRLSLVKVTSLCSVSRPTWSKAKRSL